MGGCRRSIRGLHEAFGGNGRKGATGLLPSAHDIAASQDLRLRALISIGEAPSAAHATPLRTSSFFHRTPFAYIPPMEESQSSNIGTQRVCENCEDSAWSLSWMSLVVLTSVSFLHILCPLRFSVCAQDADLSFLSRDGVVFRLHSKYLDVSAGGFPPTDLPQPTDDGEEPTIPLLTENSDVLDLLFQHTHPQAHPQLDGVDFNVLEDLANAAEKYLVYSAMEVCRLLMK